MFKFLILQVDKATFRVSAIIIQVRHSAGTFDLKAPRVDELGFARIAYLVRSILKFRFNL